MNNNSALLAIGATGIVSPLGGDTEMTLAAVLAGLSAYQISSASNRNGYKMVTARVPDEILADLKPELKKLSLGSREQKLIKLASLALRQVFNQYEFTEPVPLFLAGPEALFESVKVITPKILSHIKIQSECEIDTHASRYLTSGRAGFIEAIEIAFRYFSASGAAFALVGGVDTYLDPATLGELDNLGRVLAEDSQSAFAPAEGASILLLINPHSINKSKLTGEEFYLCRPGFAQESGALMSNLAYRGDGLALAVRQALEQASPTLINKIFSTANGEGYFSKEYGVSIIRNMPRFSNSFTHIHPADCLGDMGAAMGGTLVSLAMKMNASLSGPTQSLVYCSSDLASRAAVCVTRFA